MTINKKYVSIIIILVLVFSAVLFWIFEKYSNPYTKEIRVKESEISNQENVDSLKEDSGEGEEIPVNDLEKTEAQEVENQAENKNIESSKSQAGTVPKIIQKPVSWGYQKSSGRVIDTIIIHSSYNAMGGDEYDTDKLIKEYKSYGVSPHYLIDRAGNIYKLVDENNIAYHAGESKTPDGRTNVNNFSIGIELMNTKKDKNTSGQYASLNSLLAYLKGKYKIKYVLGHSQIASGRKDDPWNFDWGKIGL